MINWNLDFFEAAKGSDSFLGEFVDLDKLVYPFKVEDHHMGYLDCIVDRDIYEAIDMDGFAVYLNEKGRGWEVGIMDGDVFVPYGSERYDHLLGNF